MNNTIKPKDKHPIETIIKVYVAIFGFFFLLLAFFSLASPGTWSNRDPSMINSSIRINGLIDFFYAVSLLAINFEHKILTKKPFMYLSLFFLLSSGSYLTFQSFQTLDHFITMIIFLVLPFTFGIIFWLKLYKNYKKAGLIKNI